MDKKLNFLFASKPLKSLLFKILLFGFALGIVCFSNFSLLALAGFVLLLILIYFSQLSERSHFRTSFFILIPTALFALSLFSSYRIWFLLILVFSFIFYLLLGLAALIFKNRHSVYLFLNTCLLLIVFLLFFSADKSKHFLLISLLFFLIVFLLLRECFNFSRSAVHNPLFLILNSQFASLLIAFLSLELFWAINLLPIGFINSALLQTLFVFFMRDFALAHFSGRLNRRFLIYHFLIFVILVSLIFIVSNWSI